MIGLIVAGFFILAVVEQVVVRHQKRKRGL